MKSLAARAILFALLLSVITIHWIGRLSWRLFGKTNNRPNRIVMIGTFYNPGWFYAHAGPLIQCKKVDELLVVCDEPINLDMAGVSFHCPSEQLKARVGRGLARVITLFRVGWHLRPRIYMGYHIIPNGPLALLAAGLFGGKAIYQMTGGPIQIIGGGFQSENPLLRATRTFSRLQEILMFTLVRCFDAVIVRGSKAREFVFQNKLSRTCFIITGAIDTSRFQPGNGERDIDVTYVSRLVENKGVEEFLSSLAALSAIKPDIKASIVGDGPLRSLVEKAIYDLDIKDNVVLHGKLSDVSPVLKRSKIFTLLSPSEGMSIAMLEAMAAGLPVIVTNVGDLSDAVQGKESGVLIEQLNPKKIAAEILRLLENRETWEHFSQAARSVVIDQFSTQAISNRWQQELGVLLT